MHFIRINLIAFIYRFVDVEYIIINISSIYLDYLLN